MLSDYSMQGLEVRKFWTHAITDKIEPAIFGPAEGETVEDLLEPPSDDEAGPLTDASSQPSSFGLPDAKDVSRLITQGLSKHLNVGDTSSVADVSAQTIAWDAYATTAGLKAGAINLALLASQVKAMTASMLKAHSAGGLSDEWLLRAADVLDSAIGFVDSSEINPLIHTDKTLARSMDRAAAIESVYEEIKALALLIIAVLCEKGPGSGLSATAAYMLKTMILDIEPLFFPAERYENEDTRVEEVTKMLQQAAPLVDGPPVGPLSMGPDGSVRVNAKSELIAGGVDKWLSGVVESTQSILATEFQAYVRDFDREFRAGARRLGRLSVDEDIVFSPFAWLNHKLMISMVTQVLCRGHIGCLSSR